MKATIIASASAAIFIAAAASAQPGADIGAQGGPGGDGNRSDPMSKDILARERSGLSHRVQVDQITDAERTTNLITFDRSPAAFYQPVRQNTSMIETVGGITNRATVELTGVGGLSGITQSGEGNLASLTQSGIFNTSLISQTGHSNSAVVTQGGGSNLSSITQTGNNNRSTVGQNVP